MHSVTSPIDLSWGFVLCSIAGIWRWGGSSAKCSRIIWSLLDLRWGILSLREEGTACGWVSLLRIGQVTGLGFGLVRSDRSWFRFFWFEGLGNWWSCLGRWSFVRVRRRCALNGNWRNCWLFGSRFGSSNPWWRSCLGWSFFGVADGWFGRNALERRKLIAFSCDFFLELAITHPTACVPSVLWGIWTSTTEWSLIIYFELSSEGMNC